MFDCVDKLNRPFVVGDTVLRAVAVGRAADLRQCVVTHVTKTDVYLDGSKQAIVYPERLVIITSLLVKADPVANTPISTSDLLKSIET